MKLIILFFVSIHLASLSPLKRQPIPKRRYFTEENDPYRISEIYFQDKNGKIQVENLKIFSKSVRTTSPEDITIYLYTQKYSNMGFPFSLTDFNSLKNSSIFDSTKENYFIIHGWKNDYTSAVNVIIKEMVLKTHDVNVFVVDWSSVASGLYITSRWAVPDIGKYLGGFINNLMLEYDLSGKMFKLVGHSLGAHIAGSAGATVNGTIEYIVGLDPASPLFTLSNTDERLDETDAKFVQVVHTSILGFSSAIGHADYFPNNGYYQPGCGFDLIGTCAHSRGYYYFAESISQGGFIARQCSSYAEYKNRKCENYEQSFIGTFNVDTRAAGDYYLDTNTEEPYALGL